METATCPYCQSALKKAPERKTKCPACGKAILVRTRPEDRVRVAVTETEAQAIDERWAMHRERELVLDAVRDGIDAERALLAAKFGGPPLESDVIWSLLLKQRQLHSSGRDWGLFRNDTFHMAVLLQTEGKHAAAVPHFIDVCCLDVWLEEDLCRETSTRLGSVSGILAPGVISRFSQSVSHASVSRQELHGLLEQRLAKLPMLARWKPNVDRLHRGICAALGMPEARETRGGRLKRGAAPEESSALAQPAGFLARIRNWISQR